MIGYIVALVLVIFTVLIIWWLISRKSSNEKYIYFQNFSPTLREDTSYYNCSTRCNPADVWCKQKCWYDAFKKESPSDVCDILCGEEKLLSDDSWYMCLDKCYGHWNRPLFMY